MKYSVIIPAYQCADTIEETVESALKAGLYDFEIIIIDDGSTDNTSQVCKALSEKHNEIRYIRKENGGVSSARNLGIEIASGDYILFMDSDDIFDIGSLKEPCKKVEESKPDMLIFGLSFDYFSDRTLYMRNDIVYPEEGVFAPHKWCNAFADLFEYNALSPVWNKFYKASIIKNNNITFNKNVFIMEDFLFVLDCLQNTDNIYLYPKAIYRYRQPEDEMRVYNRINRVNDINDYLKPFYKSIDNLTHSLENRFHLSFPQGEEVLFKLYKMFVSQKAYYADTEILKSLSETHKKSPWADYKTDDLLITDLNNENYKNILKRHKKIQLRHKIAVKVKKTSLYQKLRGN